MGWLGAALLALAGCGGTSYSNPQATTYRISGTVTGPAAGGVTVTLSGASSATTTTDSSGHFTFGNLPNGAFAITPARTGYTFSPTSRSVIVNGADFANQDFTETANPPSTFSISGTITGPVASGISVALTGTSSAIAMTDGSGHYTFNNLANGAYVITPSLTGYTFNPASANVTVNGANLTDRNFTQTAAGTPTYSVSGTVSGDTPENVHVALSGAATLDTTTDSAGHYTFTGLAAGAYTLTPTLSGFAFTPDHRDVTVAGADITGQDFAETAVSICVQDLQPTFTDIYTRLLRVSCAGCHSGGGAPGAFANADPVVALAALRDQTPNQPDAKAAGWKRAKSGDATHSLILWKLDPANQGTTTYGAVMPFGSDPSGVCAQNLTAITQWITDGAKATTEGTTCTDDTPCGGNLRCVAGKCGYKACGTDTQPTFASIYSNLLVASCSGCHGGSGGAVQIVDADPTTGRDSTYALLAGVDPSNTNALAAGWKRISNDSGGDANVEKSFLFQKIAPGLNTTLYGAQMPRNSSSNVDPKNGSVCPATIDAVREWIRAGANNDG